MKYPTDQRPLWAGYREWLLARGIKANTATVYGAQVRRALREVADPTPERLSAWAETNDAIAAQTRNAWRSFRTFAATLDVALCDWPSSTEVAQAARVGLVRAAPAVVVLTEMPESVQGAIRQLRSAGVRPKLAQAATWAPFTAVTSTATTLYLAAPPGFSVDVLSVPHSAAQALRAWGYPNREPASHDPLLPRAPGDSRLMALALIREIMG